MRLNSLNWVTNAIPFHFLFVSCQYIISLEIRNNLKAEHYVCNFHIQGKMSSFQTFFGAKKKILVYRILTFRFWFSEMRLWVSQNSISASILWLTFREWSHIMPSNRGDDGSSNSVVIFHLECSISSGSCVFRELLLEQHARIIEELTVEDM